MLNFRTHRIRRPDYW